MTSRITQETLRERWKELPVDPSTFDDCIHHPIIYIALENYERKLYCFQCEEIAFHNVEGDPIWSTTGSGFMDGLPKQVSVMIKEGKYRFA
ncbi:hypothetical protein BDV59DRAFT_194301 [Aspergillus ambiguus]|uniref:uncharacterized protein n=1 Tax=Aspergillus ambiguus TaxID=176160 RepID=UPI003CCCC1F8